MAPSFFSHKIKICLNLMSLTLALVFFSSYNPVGNDNDKIKPYHDFVNTIDSAKDDSYYEENSIIYVVKTLNGYANYWKEYGQEITVAIPIAIFTNGKYINPPYCEIGATSREAIIECRDAKKKLSPAVQPGSKLYILNNGIRESGIFVSEEINYGLSDWTRPSAILPYRPSHALLTNNPRIGVNQLVDLEKSDRPILPKRKKHTGSGYYSDILLSKVDIDGDRIPELVYESKDWEGTFYVIYSKKNGRWKLVHEGGYDGV